VKVSCEGGLRQISVPGGEVRLKGAMVVVVVLAEAMVAVLESKRRKKYLGVVVDNMRGKRRYLYVE
jgi:hypothetical protein